MSLSFKFMLTLILLLFQGNTFSSEKIPQELQNGSTPFPSMPTRMNEGSCGKLDLSDELGPVHDQTAGTCYAYTALDLMNFGASKRYSPLYLATLKTLSPLPTAPACPGEPNVSPNIFSFVGGMNSGDIAEAIELGMSTGLCPENLFPSSDRVLKEDYKKILEYYQHLRVGDKTIVEICDPKDPRLLSDLLATSGKSWKSNAIKRQAKHMFPSLEVERISAIANASTSVDQFMKVLGTEACSSALDKNVPAGKTAMDVKHLGNLNIINCKKIYYEEDRAPILDLINKALDQGKPAGISFVTGGLIQEPHPTTHAYHAAVVAGRSWQNGVCNYLVKNSWGADWKVRAGLKARSSNHPGYFVVSEKQLMEHLYGSVAID